MFIIDWLLLLSLPDWSTESWDEPHIYKFVRMVCNRRSERAYPMLPPSLSLSFFLVSSETRGNENLSQIEETQVLLEEIIKRTFFFTFRSWKSNHKHKEKWYCVTHLSFVFLWITEGKFKQEYKIVNPKYKLRSYFYLLWAITSSQMHIMVLLY